MFIYTMYIYIHIYVYIHIHIYIYIHVYIKLFIYSYVYAYVLLPWNNVNRMISEKLRSISLLFYKYMCVCMSIYSYVFVPVSVQCMYACVVERGVATTAWKRPLSPTFPYLTFPSHITTTVPHSKFIVYLFLFMCRLEIIWWELQLSIKMKMRMTTKIKI